MSLSFGKFFTFRYDCDSSALRLICVPGVICTDYAVLLCREVSNALSCWGRNRYTALNIEKEWRQYCEPLVLCSGRNTLVGLRGKKSQEPQGTIAFGWPCVLR